MTILKLHPEDQGKTTLHMPPPAREHYILFRYNNAPGENSGRRRVRVTDGIHIVFDARARDIAVYTDDVAQPQDNEIADARINVSAATDDTWVRFEVAFEPIVIARNAAVSLLFTTPLPRDIEFSLGFLLREQPRGKRSTLLKSFSIAAPSNAPQRSDGRLELPLTDRDALTLLAYSLECRSNDAMSLHFFIRLNGGQLNHSFCRPAVSVGRDVIKAIRGRLRDVNTDWRKTPAVKRESRQQTHHKFVAWIEGLPEHDLLSLVKEVESRVLAPRLRAYFKEKNWEKVASIEGALPLPSRGDEIHWVLTGRAAIYVKDYAKAIRLLTVFSTYFPGNVEAALYLGIAHARTGNYEEAVRHLRRACEGQPHNSQAHREFATSLRRLAKSTENAAARFSLECEALESFKVAFAQSPNPSLQAQYARALFDLQRFGECLTLLSNDTQESVSSVDVNIVTQLLLLKLRALVAVGSLAEALDCASEILAVQPGHQAAQYHLRALRHLRDMERPAAPILFPLHINELAASDSNDALAMALAKARDLDANWIVLHSSHHDAPALERDLNELSRATLYSGGFAEAKTEQLGEVALWRIEAIEALREAEQFTNGVLTGLKRHSTKFAPRSTQTGEGNCIVMSRHGAYKFGGGEHFIASMAEHYRTAGLIPIIVGTRPELVGKTGVVDGVQFAFLPDDPSMLRKYILENDIKLVHAISGTGMLAASAVSYTNVPLIYGVHFWREVLGESDDGPYFDGSGRPLPRREFSYILSTAASVYVNSEFTREILERAHGVRCPVIYSVPSENGHD